MRTIMIILCSTLFVACGDTTSTPADTAVARDMAVATTADMAVICCGHPGDVGNEKGIGKFCNEGKDCMTGQVCANLLGDNRMHFCTTPCNPDMGDACGTASTCLLLPGQPAAGCVPAACLPIPAGCDK